MATLVGFGLSMLIGVAVAARCGGLPSLGDRSLPGRGQRHAQDRLRCDLLPVAGSDYAVYGMAVAIAVFVTIMVRLHAGFRGVDPNKMKLAYTFGASRWQGADQVILPAACPR